MGNSESAFPPCPHLPQLRADRALDWRLLHELGPDRGERFFERCLLYSQYLWTRGLAARAILAADRGLFAELTGDEPVLRVHPLPYLALAWMIAHTPSGTFLGNPRVHYQHLADRVRGPLRDQRSARAWAAWHLARTVRPGLPGDPRHLVQEPTLEQTGAALDRHGIPGERIVWQTAITEVRSWPTGYPAS